MGKLVLVSNSYILNRGWIDRSSKRVPTYGEVTSQSKKGKAKADPAEAAEGSGAEGGAGEDDSEEEEVFDDIVDRFESSYNFRFEETWVCSLLRPMLSIDRTTATAPRSSRILETCLPLFGARTRRGRTPASAASSAKRRSWRSGRKKSGG
jgi:hypothetical protein